jgi:epoxyqueuosine reductase
MKNEEWIKSEASALGFSLCGISGPLEKKYSDFNEWWVNQGFGAGMFYLRSQLEKRKDLEKVFPGAKSVVMLAMRFPGSSREDTPSPEGAGKIARYAVNEDYHELLLPKISELAKKIDEQLQSRSVAYVDTGAINERAYGAQSGIGWIGKNAMLIHPEEGSWMWLGCILTSAILSPDSPMADHCGKCRKCIEACPTGAILEELRAVDSNKCIPYWNIEHRGAIPEVISSKMGNRLLGCDICQEICPWNSHSLKKSRAEIGEPKLEWMNVDEALNLTKEEFSLRWKNKALSRAKLDGIKRNAQIVKKNSKI